MTPNSEVRGDRNAVSVVYEDGEEIVVEGDLSREMYIIQEGQVVVEKNAGGTTLRLGTLERGDFFGEMSLLQDQPRSATVRSVGHTKLMVLHSGSFLMQLRRDPTFAFEVINTLCTRLRRVETDLVHLIARLDLKPEDVDIILKDIQMGSSAEKE